MVDATAPRIGLIVNPIAGMGGRVGLKGTDGTDAFARAVALGATPMSSERALIALQAIDNHLKRDWELVVARGRLGESVARKSDVARVIVVGDAVPDTTTSMDTINGARQILGAGVDLLLFAGGDGTARDILTAVGSGPPTLGIPTGVKMHSSVYATSPRAAGELASLFVQDRQRRTREQEVMDIDEDAFRLGRLSARLFGYLTVPYEPRLVQGLKSGSASSDQSGLAGIAAEIAERIEDGTVWIFGPGTTTRFIADHLGLPKTLLGVDLYLNGDRIVADATEQEIRQVVGNRPARIVVTPIGGQGFVFGRGNQQLSPDVIRQVGRDRIIIVATPGKLTELGGAPLLVDTGDADLDDTLRGYHRVVTGFRQESMQRIG